MAVVPFGQVVKGVDVPVMGLQGAGLLLAIHPHPKLAIAGGAEIAGHSADRNRDETDSMVVFKFPIMVRYTPTGRTRGPWIEAGASLGSHMLVDGISLRSDLPEARFGLGWRLRAMRHLALDIFVEGNAGQFDHAEGLEIRSDARAWQGSAALGISLTLD